MKSNRFKQTEVIGSAKIAEKVLLYSGPLGLLYPGLPRGCALGFFFGRPPKQLTNFQSETIFSFAWSPDGKQLALVRNVVNNDVVLITGFK